MKRLRGASLFSGGGGWEVRLPEIDWQWGVEYDPKIAAVHEQNIGGTCIVSRVQDVPIAMLPPIDLLVASPVCKNFSQAKTGGTEHADDLSAAQAVVAFVTHHAPRYFFLENVMQYRTSQSFRIITTALDTLGYNWHVEVCNAADYGVPQTRRRLILRAWTDPRMIPALPSPQPWVGWYAAIADLIPTLPESQFAPWQLKRLPELATSTFLIGSGNTNLTNPTSKARFDTEPMFTVRCGMHSPPRAFILDGQTNAAGATVTSRTATDPMFTVSASADKRPARAFLFSNGNTKQEGPGFRAGDDPAFTCTASTHPDRASLPSGRVVAMTPRALARFQSLPDTYTLPASNALACTIIGNMIPALLARAVVRSLTEAL